MRLDGMLSGISELQSQGRKPPRVRRAPFPQPPAQLASEAATEFALPQHITDPPPAAAPAAAALAATNGHALSADGAEQQASPSVWAKIVDEIVIADLGRDGAPTAAVPKAAAHTAEHTAAGAAAAAAQPAQVQDGDADGSAVAEAAASGPAAGLAGGDSGAELPQPSGAGLVPQALPAADADLPAADDLSGMPDMPQQQQQVAALAADGQDGAVPMDVDTAAAASELEAAVPAAPASADQPGGGSAAPVTEQPAEPAAQASSPPAGQAADAGAAATAVAATDELLPPDAAFPGPAELDLQPAGEPRTLDEAVQDLEASWQPQGASAAAADASQQQQQDQAAAEVGQAVPGG